MELQPETSTALVVGGSGGIGRVICMALGRAGWRVAVHYHRGEKSAHATVEALHSSGGSGLVCCADVRQAGQVNAMVEELCRKEWAPRALVCAAGVASSQMVVRQAYEDWDQVIATNLTGTFHCVQAVVPEMAARKEGSVIILGSFAGWRGTAGQAAYAASKAGLVGLVRTAAREWGRDNVRIHLLLPGWQRTRLSFGAMPDADGFEDHVLGRPPSVAEVASTVLHLLNMKDSSGNIWNCDSRLL